MLLNQSSALSGYRAEALHLKQGEKPGLFIRGSAIIFIKKGKITPFLMITARMISRKDRCFFCPSMFIVSYPPT